MKTLWFKAKYVDDVVAGKKTDTVRPASIRLPAVGELLALSVGPQRPFRFARVMRIRRVRKLSIKKSEDLALCYATVPNNLVHIEFQLIQNLQS
jgi:hypothetical protein